MPLDSTFGDGAISDQPELRAMTGGVPLTWTHRIDFLKKMNLALEDDPSDPRLPRGHVLERLSNLRKNIEQIPYLCSFSKLNVCSVRIGACTNDPLTGLDLHFR